MTVLSRPRVLVLYVESDADSCEFHPSDQGPVSLSGLASPHYEVVYCNAADGASAWLRHLKFHAVLLHGTYLGQRTTAWFFLWKWRTRWLANLHCPKIAMPQDEYDHCELLDEWLFELGVDVIYSHFGEPARSLLYPLMSRRARFVQCVGGYVDDAMARRYASVLHPVESRPYDVVRREGESPFWLGRHGQTGQRIGEEFRRCAGRLGLSVADFNRGLDGSDERPWPEVLASGKTVLGHENGSDVLDRRGEVRSVAEALLRETPSLPFNAFSERMHPGWDAYRFRLLSPRHLEAVMTKTCQILVEGRYGDVLRPHEHYIPVKPDLSDLETALHSIRDPDRLRTITERAYEDIVMSGRYSYKALADEIGCLAGAGPRYRPLGEAAAKMLWPFRKWAVAFSRQTARVRLEVENVVQWLISDGAIRLSLMGMVGSAQVMLCPPLRHLFVRALRRLPEPRLVNRLHGILADLVRLNVIRRITSPSTAQRDAPVRLGVYWEQEQAKLKLVTIRNPGKHGESALQQGRGSLPDWTAIEKALVAGLVEDIEWDHSLCRQSAADVRDPALAPYFLPFGLKDCHKFRAVVSLCKHDSRETAECVLAILLQDRQDDRRKNAWDAAGAKHEGVKSRL